MEAGLETAIRNSSYAALVQQTEVKRVALPDDTPGDGYMEERLVYQARVLQTFRGPSLSDITYTVDVAAGDEAPLSEQPIILALCNSETGFHSPGAGSQFPATAELVMLAESASAWDTGVYAYCL